MPSAFENLPREIRDLIYSYCLICEKEIVPYPNIWERQVFRKSIDRTLLVGTYFPDTLAGNNRRMTKRRAGYRNDLPCIALLVVNHRIHEESANVLFGANQWRLSENPINFPIAWDNDPQMSRFWFRYARFCRRIALRLDFRDTPAIQMQEIDIYAASSEEGPGDDEFSTRLHCFKDGAILDTWEEKMTFISSSMPVTSVFIDITNGLCPHGCCRDWFMRWLHYGLRRIGSWRGIRINEASKLTIDYHRYPFENSSQIKPRQIKIQGFLDEDEEGRFMENLHLDIDLFLGRTKNEILENEGHKQFVSRNFPGLIAALESP